MSPQGSGQLHHFWVIIPLPEGEGHPNALANTDAVGNSTGGSSKYSICGEGTHHRPLRVSGSFPLRDAQEHQVPDTLRGNATSPINSKGGAYVSLQGSTAS